MDSKQIRFIAEIISPDEFKESQDIVECEEMGGKSIPALP
jgi:hypothetical protein